jgi:hypothetical protein
VLEVRTANKPQWPMELSVFLFSLLWVILSVVILVIFENLLIVATLQLIGIPLWFLLVKRQTNINTIRKAEEKKFYGSLGGFVCQNCCAKINSPLKTQNINGEPILYHCESCEILWFTGVVDNSALS